MSNFQFNACREVNPFLNEAIFTASENEWNLYIPKLDIRFTDKPTILRIIHSGLRSIVSDYNANKGKDVPEHIALQLSVWKESGIYLTPKEKESALKKVTVSQTTAGKKSGYLYASRRLILEGWLVDRKGIDFTKSFQALSDPEFEAWMKSDKKIPQWLRERLDAYDKAEAAKLLDLEARVQAKVDTLPDDDFDDDSEESGQDVKLQEPVKPKNGKGK